MRKSSAPSMNGGPAAKGRKSVFSSSTQLRARVRLPPLNFQGEDARQWIDDVAVYFLRDRIRRDKLRQARYLALVVDNGNWPSGRTSDSEG